MSQGNTRLIERWFETQTSHDLEEVADLFSNDVIYEDVALGSGPIDVSAAI